MDDLTTIEPLPDFRKQRRKKPETPKRILRRLWLWGGALTVLACFLAGLNLGYDFGSDRSLMEDFTHYRVGHCYPEGAEFGPWLSRFNSFGCNEVREMDGAPYLHLTPPAAAAADKTKASLVTGPGFRGELTFQADLYTTRQLRLNSPVNNWEVGWMIWNYTDNDHFYYFIPKPNGWELGKRDPAYKGKQRFLMTNDATHPATFPIGDWHNVRVAQNGNRMTVFVNNKPLTTFTDTERPYRHGQIGFYSEDAETWFGNVWATGTPDNLIGYVLDLFFSKT